MNRIFARARTIFLVIFLIVTAAIWIYQIGWVLPRQHCEERGRWWSPHDRACAVPVSLSTFTGRPNHPAVVAAPPR